MPEYPQPGAEQRSQQKFIIFDRFERMNTQAARVGLPDNQLAWLENLQPLAENKLQVVPAPAAPAVALPENIVLEFYAAMNNQDWLILFTTAGSGFYYNITNGMTGQFAPDGTFSTAPDCTTWQGQRILINDSIAGYCTWDGTLFVQSGMMSPNMNVTAAGANYFTPPPVSLLVNGAGGVACSVVSPGSFTAPGAGQVALTIPAPPAGGVQATGYATVVGTALFSVQSVTITNAGAGYTTPFPTITLPGVIGTAPVFSGYLSANGATAASTINSAGQLTSVFLTNPGTGFAPADTVTVVIGSTGGSGATLTKVMAGAGLASITIVGVGNMPNVGNGTFALTISAPPAGGTQAAATFRVSGGVAVLGSIVITNPGAGYLTAPVVSFPPGGSIPGNTPPTFAAVMGNTQVASIALTAGGTGYPPSATLPLLFTGSTGTPPATGTATTSAGGVVISATLLTGGSYELGANPTVTVGGGTGATAGAHIWPFVPAGTTLAVFQGRVFLGGGQLLQWSGTGATAGYGNVGYDDFLVADNSGATKITDADLVHSITALRSFNNYLWILGDQSIKQIGTLFPSGAPPFQLLTLSSDQGTIWPKSCISYNRILLFANPNGIFGVFGSTVQKISDDLDGIFQLGNFTQQPQGAVVDLNSKHNAVFLLRYNDPSSGTRSLLLVFDGKRWWIGNQGSTLVAIVSAPIFATDINQLWGSIIGTDLTQLFANPAGAQPFKISTALSHNTNPVQGKRVIRAGFTAHVRYGIAPVNMLVEADTISLPRVLAVAPNSLLVGGANDDNNAPISISGVYLGATLSGTFANLTLHNVVLEYQETSLWKGGGPGSGVFLTAEDGTLLATEVGANDLYVAEV